MGYRDADGDWVDPCLQKLKPGEPFVVLRGQDMLAPDSLRKWVTDAKANGVPEAKVADMQATIDEMEKWQPRKIPD